MMNIIKLIHAIGVTVGGLVLARWSYCVFFYQQIIPDKFSGSSVFLLLVLLDMHRLKPGTNHTIRSLVMQYVVNRALYLAGLILLRRLFTLCKDVRKHQEELLKSIIKANEDTKVAQHFDLRAITDIEEYRANVPLTSYCDYEKFSIDVRQNGSKNVFFPGNADYVAMTSGTTSGKSKHFPKSLKLLRNKSGKWLLLSQKCFLDIKGNNYLRKWLVVRANPKTWFCESGIKTGPISGLASNYSLNPYVVPGAGNELSNEEDVIYLNLVFGLKTSDICNLFFSTAQMALLFFQVLERRWEEICDDIESGELTKDLNNVPTSIRESMTSYLNGGDRNRARALRNEFVKGIKDIVPRVWPDCPGLFCLATGSFQTQADVVKERYLGQVPLFSPYHAGSEAFYGINLELEDSDISYTAMTAFIFFEFVPLDQIDDENPSTLLCHQVVIGEQYELVVSTYEGLYRYRTEDIVEISGFRGTIPKYKFIRRTGDVLSAGVERVPEILVSRALRKVASKWNTSLVDFVSTESIHIERQHEQPYYAIFVEIQENGHLTDEQRDMVDDELQHLHEIYALYRQNNKMKPVRVIQMRPGTFQYLATEIIAQNECTIRTQYKLPRIIRRASLLTFLLSHRLNGISH